MQRHGASLHIFDNLKTCESSYLNFDDLYGALRLFVEVENGEFIPFGNHFQFERVSFGSIVAPEVVFVVVEIVLVGCEREPSGVAATDAFQRQGFVVEETSGGWGSGAYSGQRTHPVYTFLVLFLIQ